MALKPIEVPPSLGGKEFEGLIMDQAARFDKLGGYLTMGRYGVNVSMIGGKWIPVPSLPDFEGVEAGGRQFIIEAKTTGAVSFPLNKKSLKPKQITHMVKRASKGSPCMLMIHFRERQGVRSHSPSELKVFPVHGDIPWVAEYLKKLELGLPLGSLPRSEGSPVQWVKFPKCRVGGPDLLSAIRLADHTGRLRDHLRKGDEVKYCDPGSRNPEYRDFPITPRS